MIYTDSSGKIWDIQNPHTDQILQWGIYVPYNESSNEEEYVILHDYVFWSARLQSVVIVPRWFITDLASIPKPARIIVTKSGKSKLPALVHDVLYFMHSNFPESVTYSRKTADKVLRDFCEYRGMGKFVSSLVYAGVRVGGSEAFRSKDEAFLPDTLKDAYIKRFSYLGLKRSNGYFDVI